MLLLRVRLNLLRSLLCCVAKPAAVAREIENLLNRFIVDNGRLTMIFCCVAFVWLISDEPNATEFTRIAEARMEIR